MRTMIEERAVFPDKKGCDTFRAYIKRIEARAKGMGDVGCGSAEEMSSGAWIAIYFVAEESRDFYKGVAVGIEMAA